MMNEEEIKKVFIFSKEYDKRIGIVKGLEKEISRIQKELGNETEKLNSLRQSELIFLNEMKRKYNWSDNEVVQNIQKILLANG